MKPGRMTIVLWPSGVAVSEFFAIATSVDVVGQIESCSVISGVDGVIETRDCDKIDQIKSPNYRNRQSNGAG